MQLSNIPVIIACFFLLLFSLHLFVAKKGSKSQNRLLSLLFFSRFGQILTSMLLSHGSGKVASIVFQVFTPLYFAAPACFYLYIVGFVENKRLKKNMWLHFIPAALAVIHVIPWPGMTSLEWKIIAAEFSENGYLSLRVPTGLFPAYFQYVVRPILILSYLALCWYTIKLAKPRMIGIQNSTRDWMYFLLKVATFFQIIGFLPILFRAFEIPIYHTFFIILNCIVLLGILLYALHKPQLFYGYLLVATDWNGNNTIKDPIFIQTPDTLQQDLSTLNESKRTIQTEKRISLSSEQISSYCDQLKEAMEKENLFLNPDLQIIDLAGRLNISVHHCSYVINNHMGKNFRDWINGYRIAHFLIQYPLLVDKMTIEAIANGCGFKSRPTFYNAFKKEKGIMPTAHFASQIGSTPT